MKPCSQSDTCPFWDKCPFNHDSDKCRNDLSIWNRVIEEID